MKSVMRLWGFLVLSLGFVACVPLVPQMRPMPDGAVSGDVVSERVLVDVIGGCEPDANFACVCTDGLNGRQVCLANRTLGSCSCSTVSADTGPSSTDVAGCEPGTSAACACTDGSSGTQVCEPDRTYAPCDCSVPDAAAEDDSG